MRHPNIVAAGILGACLVLAAALVSAGLNNLATKIEQRPGHPPVPRFPDTITVRTGNEDINVRVQAPRP